MMREKIVKKAFEPVTVIRLDPKAAQEWRRKRIIFCENNGHPFEGNAFLIEERNVDALRYLTAQLAEINIDLNQFITRHNSYHTSGFGFDLGFDWLDFYEMDYDALEICEVLMARLKIEWCGWAEASSFLLLANDEQLAQFRKLLRKPIIRWRAKNGFPPIPADCEL